MSTFLEMTSSMLKPEILAVSRIIMVAGGKSGAGKSDITGFAIIFIIIALFLVNLAIAIQKIFGWQVSVLDAGVHSMSASKMLGIHEKT